MAKLETEVEPPPALKRNILLAAAAAVVVAAGGVTLALLQASSQAPEAPLAPVLASAPAQDAAPPPPTPLIAPSFDVVRVNPEGSAVIAGRAAPNATVTILDGSSKLGQVTADSNGQFVFLPDAALPPGGQQLSLASRAPDGAVATSEGTVLLVVPDRSPQAGTANAPPPPLAVLTLPDAPSRLLTSPPDALPTSGSPPAASPSADQPDAAALAAAKHRHLGLDVVDYDDHGAIRFAGSAPPNTSVRVYIDNHHAGDAVADALGHWTMTPPDAPAAGMHRLRVDQINPQGRVMGRVEQPFQRVMIDPASIGADRVLVQPGENLWRLARVVYGTGTRYTVIYQANRDQIRDPRLIYPGQAFAVPAAPPAGSIPASSDKSR